MLISIVFDIFTNLLTHLGLECPNLNIGILIFGIFIQKEKFIIDGDYFNPVFLLYDLLDGIEELEVVDRI
jgi:hypothetical protein